MKVKKINNYYLSFSDLEAKANKIFDTHHEHNRKGNN